jgi:hypothetical protein
MDGYSDTTCFTFQCQWIGEFLNPYCTALPNRFENTWPMRVTGCERAR